MHLGRRLALASGALLSFPRAMSVNAPTAPLKINKTEDEWRSRLSDEEFYVLRKKGTERPFTGEYDQHFAPKGIYRCRACEAPLYSAASKFKSGCGWPAFDRNFQSAVNRHVDTSLGMKRTEITCASCGGHLGHVFEGEHLTPKNQRHCVNSISVKYDPDGSIDLPEE